MDPEEVLKKIYKNKALPYHEAIANHNALLAEYHQAVKDRLTELESAAFGDLEPAIVSKPLEAVRLALKDNDPQRIKTAAQAAYEQGRYPALRLAAEFDQDIAALVDHLETYGELQSANQRVFLRFALSPPQRRNDYMPALR
jgi:hypothetical protein